MEFRQLYYYTQIVDCGSFSAAASKLYMTQPALSRVMKSLENELNTKLFYYVDKKVVPTATGKILYEQGKKILDEYETTLTLLQQSSVVQTGIVSIVTTLRRAKHAHVTEAISNFVDSYPGVTVNVSLSNNPEALDGIRKHLYDVGFFLDDIERKDDLSRTVLDVGDYYILMSKNHPLSEKKELSFADLRGETILRYSEGTAAYDALKNGCIKYNFEPNIRTMSSQTDLLFNMVRKNQGICMIAYDLLPSEKGDDLVCLPITELNNRVATIMATSTGGYHSPAVKLFIAFITEYENKRKEDRPFAGREY